MSETPRDARGLLDALSGSHAGAYALARVVSLAARVEPALVRRARLELLPHLGAGDEADLWFGPLVQARSPLAVVFSPEVAAQLRLRLAEDQRMLRRAWEVSRRVHAHSSPVILLEEEVTYLALSDEPGAAERVRALLMSAAREMVEGDGRGIAQWALRALPRLPERARNSEEAWALAVGAGARLGGRRILEGEAPGSVPRGMLSWVLPEAHRRARVGVRLLDAGVEFSEPPAEGAHVLEVPKTDPLLLEVVWGGGAESRQVTLRPGHTLVVETGPAEEVSVVTPTGETFSVRREYEFDVFIYETAATKNIIARLRHETWPDGRPLRVATLARQGIYSDYGMRSDQLYELQEAHSKEVEWQKRASRKVVEEVTEYDLKVLLARRAASSPGGEDGDPRVIRVYTKGGELSVDLSPYVNVAFSDASRFEQSYRKLLALIKDEPYVEEPETSRRPEPVKLYLSYSHKDEGLKERLVSHLAALRSEGVAEILHDAAISEGADWEAEINAQLNAADIILMLVSADFLNSQFIHDVEMKRALERHDAREARVVPVILRPCDWLSTPLARFVALPPGGRPVTTWEDEDEALLTVVKGLREAALEAAGDKEAGKPREEASDRKRVFISHSAKEDDSEVLLDVLGRSLREAGFDYFNRDDDLMTAGASWRQEWNTELARADAAVVLLSESALSSNWVGYEVAALSQRRQPDEGFLLVPVLLEGVTLEDLRVSSALSPTLLHERQALVAEGPPEETARRIVEALAPLNERGPGGPSYFEELEREVARLLRHAPERVLRSEADEASDEVAPSGATPGAPREEPARELARLIVLGGLHGLPRRLARLSEFIPQSDAEQIVEVVAPTWVDVEAAAAVRRVAAAPPGRRALVLNCRQPLTAHMYVSRASERWPPWGSVEMRGALDERDEGAALRDFEERLLAWLRVPVGGDSPGLKDVLAARERSGEPLFVLFPPPVPSPRLLESIKAAYPTLTLFLMEGEEMPRPGEFPHDYGEVIHPALDPGEEEEMLEAYRYVKSLIEPPRAK